MVVAMLAMSVVLVLVVLVVAAAAAVVVVVEEEDEVVLVAWSWCWCWSCSSHWWGGVIVVWVLVRMVVAPNWLTPRSAGPSAPSCSSRRGWRLDPNLPIL